MQVLVELLRAGGRPVSRDTLSLRCWNNHAVSEDSLNRAIAKVRRELTAAAGAALVLETIRGVGYRLREKVTGELTHNGDLIVPAIDLETRALGAMFEGTKDGFALAVHYLKQAVAERPDDGPLHGSLAMAYVLSLSVESDGLLLAARAREAAVKAQALCPNEGRSLAALVSLEPTFGAWADKNATLEDALRRAPAGTAPLIFQRVLFLTSVGAIENAAALIEPLAAAAPLVPWIQSANAYSLAATNRVEMAIATAAAAIKRWPRSQLTVLTMFHLALAAGETAQAIELARREMCDCGLSELEQRLATDLAETLAAPNSDRSKTVLNSYAAALGNSQTLAEQAVLAAAHLGATDEAIAFLERFYSEPIPFGRGSIAFPKIGFAHPHERNTALLFLYPLRAVRQHPRYPTLLASIGLPRDAKAA